VSGHPKKPEAGIFSPGDDRFEEYAPGPREDWFCRCTEPAPDRIGFVNVLRPATQARCFVCFTDAPWSALRGDSGR